MEASTLRVQRSNYTWKCFAKCISSCCAGTVKKSVKKAATASEELSGPPQTNGTITGSSAAERLSTVETSQSQLRASVFQGVLAKTP